MTGNQYRALRAQVAGWAMMVIANLSNVPWWLAGVALALGILNFYAAYKLEGSA